MFMLILIKVVSLSPFLKDNSFHTKEITNYRFVVVVADVLLNLLKNL